MQKQVIPVILAGGASSRFWPLGNKNFVSFMGKSLLQRNIEALRTAGLNDIIVVVPRAERKIFKDHLESTLAVHVNLVYQDKSGGMGDAVLAAQKKFQSLGSQKYLYVLNSIDLIDPSWHRRVLQSLDLKSGGMIPGLVVESYFPGGYLVTDQKRRLIRVVEKPGEKNVPSNQVKLVADLFLDPEHFFTLLKREYQQPKLQDDVYERALSYFAKDRGVVVGQYSDNFGTLKYPWDVLRVAEIMLGKMERSQIHASVQIADTAVIHGPVVIAKGARVFDHAVIQGPSFIGPDSVIGTQALIVQSMLESGCVVGYGSEVTRSYLGPRVWLHQNYVGDSVLGAGVSFGAKAVTANFRFDQQEVLSKVKGEWVKTQRRKLGAVIGENSRVGIGAQLMPGIKVGMQSIVGPNVTLAKDCPDNTTLLVKQAYITQKTKLKQRPASIRRQNKFI